MTDRFPGRPKPGTLRLVYVRMDGSAFSQYRDDADFVQRRFEELRTDATINYVAIFEYGKEGPREWHTNLPSQHTSPR